MLRRVSFPVKATLRGDVFLLSCQGAVLRVGVTDTSRCPVPYAPGALRGMPLRDCPYLLLSTRRQTLTNLRQTLRVF